MVIASSKPPVRCARAISQPKSSTQITVKTELQAAAAGVVLYDFFAERRQRGHAQIEWI